MSDQTKRKLVKLKSKVFDPKTKKERLAGALTILSEVRPIEGIDKKVWKKIVEAEMLEETFEMSQHKKQKINRPEFYPQSERAPYGDNLDSGHFRLKLYDGLH